MNQNTAEQNPDNCRHGHGSDTGEHILVCLSSAPSNARIIRTAATMARAFNSQFTALYVETPDFAVATPENKRRLQDHCRLATQLGAGIEIVHGEDVAFQIAEFVRLSGITKIVLGRSAAARRHLFGKPTLTEQLLSYAPEVDIHIIPDKTADAPYHPRKARARRGADIPKNTAKSALILLGATLLSLMFHRLGFTDSNIIMVYILGVLLTSIATSHLTYSLVSSIASVFIFNYLFTVPQFSLTAYGTGYPVTFVVMFLTAFITGTFAIRYKEQARQSARTEHRTKILLDTDQLLAKARDRDEILAVTASQVHRLLDRDPVILGSMDETQQDSRLLYFPLRVSERVYGVVGIDVTHDPLDPSEQGILLSILGECALALENEQNAREKEAAAVLAESEQLRANLLRTISHDLRTPLTSISGNASNLLRSGATFDEETKLQLYTDIYSDSMWLISLVENLLSATRIEEGRMTLNTSAELLDDIVDEAMQHIGRRSGGHRLSVDFRDDLLLVKADARLIVQVIINLLDNAVKYTAPSSSVTLTTRRRGDMAEIAVSDDGPGISDEDKKKIFEKFYCGANKIADSRRSLGLGLFLCKAIVEAHGGTICVEDNVPRGTVFRFTLPREEIKLHE